MDKADHLVTREDGRQVHDPQKLQVEILDNIGGNPQLAALLGWEEHVARSSDDAIRQMCSIARTENDDLSAAINRILGELAVASAGLENAKQDVFRATNEVLNLVTVDRLMHRSATKETQSLWVKAVTDLQAESSLQPTHSARLNTFIHIEFGALLEKAESRHRGSVIDLSSLPDEVFERIWRYPRRDLLEHEFGLQYSDSIRWLMVQVQAPCDQAQQRSGLLPYVLGMSLSPSNSWFKVAKKKNHIWLSPKFADENKTWCFALHLRFVTGLSSEDVASFRVCYRIREQLLAELTHDLHSYNARPGVIRFPR